MQYNFDQIIDRRGTNAIKWDHFPQDVLPLWIADTDFAVEPEIIAHIQKRLEHPILGYSSESPELIEVVRQRMQERYQWAVDADAITLVPGIVSGFNFAIRAICEASDSVLFQQPAYPPFFDAPENNAVESCISTMVFNAEKGIYEIDFDEFESKIQPNTRLFLLCNPQNPTSRVFTPEELRKIGEICIKHDLIICSDEIHSEIIYSGFHHTPIASISKELSERTITLIAPSKTFNIPGLSCSVAIIPNKTLHKRFTKALAGFSSGVTCLSQEAAIAAYTASGEWLRQMTAYLEANRDFLTRFVAAEMPFIRLSQIQATFLSWMDCSACGIEGSPQRFFEEKAKVGLNDGSYFGKPYGDFVRLNFGTPRAILQEALEKMAAALKKG